MTPRSSDVEYLRGGSSTFQWSTPEHRHLRETPRLHSPPHTVNIIYHILHEDASAKPLGGSESHSRYLGHYDTLTFFDVASACSSIILQTLQIPRGADDHINVA